MPRRWFLTATINQFKFANLTGRLENASLLSVTKLFDALHRSNASSNSAQNQLQGFRDSLARLTSERDKLKKDVESSNSEMQEKNKTITQVKKIGRRYKSQYEELKVQHDKVGFAAVEITSRCSRPSGEGLITWDRTVCVLFQLVEEKAAKAGGEAAPSQDVQQELSKAQEELSKTKEELNKLKEEGQKTVSWLPPDPPVVASQHGCWALSHDGIFFFPFGPGPKV